MWKEQITQFSSQSRPGCRLAPQKGAHSKRRAADGRDISHGCFPLSKNQLLKGIFKKTAVLGSKCQWVLILPHNTRLQVLYIQNFSTLSQISSSLLFFFFYLLSTLPSPSFRSRVRLNPWTAELNKRCVLVHWILENRQTWFRSQRHNLLNTRPSRQSYPLFSVSWPIF